MVRVLRNPVGRDLAVVVGAVGVPVDSVGVLTTSDRQLARAGHTGDADDGDRFSFAVG